MSEETVAGGRNIGPAQRRTRLIGGVISGAIGLGIMLTLIDGGAPRIWRLALILPFLGAVLGILQHREGT